MKFTSIDDYIDGVSVLKYRMKFVNAASKQEKNEFRKRQEG